MKRKMGAKVFSSKEGRGVGREARARVLWVRWRCAWVRKEGGVECH
jgi:hypothetical protein